MTEVDKLLQNAKENLYQNEVVKEYFRLAGIIKNDAELLSLEQNMKVHERGMTINMDNDEVYFKEKELFEKYKSEIEQNPIYIDFKNVEEEVFALLLEVKRALE